MSRYRTIEDTGLRPLSRGEIEERIQRVIAEVAAPGPLHEAGEGPRWIEAAELVRRMRRFLVFN